MVQEAVRRSNRPLARRPGGQATFAALAALAALARLQISEASEVFPYVGCYHDKKGRAIPHQMQPEPPLTLEKCAALCVKDNYQFAGLEFQQEW